MIEDDSYRNSSQYRLWSYSPAQLHDIRKRTNGLASDKVRASVARARLSSSSENGHGENLDHKAADATDIETLTVEEELQIVRWGCQKILDMKDVFDHPMPSQVITTAIQYLRRFYLTNSPMSYHPKQITVTALYLATKTEHHYTDINTYCSSLANVNPDDVRAPEFLLMQGLRFSLDVRHPARSLEGGISEIKLRASSMSCFKGVSTSTAENRISKAAESARRLLVNQVQLTDAYFLFTPPQIYLAALLVVDNELTKSYIDCLFDRLGTAMPPIKQKLMATITECADLIRAEQKRSADDEGSNKELGRIGRKLKKCQDPEKTDIKALTKAKATEKREADAANEEKVAKKRKLERERLEKDADVFGPDLKTVDKKG